MINYLKYYISFCLILGMSFNSYSQSNLLNAKNPSEIGFEKDDQIDEEFLNTAMLMIKIYYFLQWYGKLLI